jgi:proteic killer suppression protein
VPDARTERLRQRWSALTGTLIEGTFHHNLDGRALTECKKGPRTRAAACRRQAVCLVALIGTEGLERAKRIPGFHDEPLKGERKGQRSIRLSRSWRAIYVIERGGIEFVEVKEVIHHDY